MKTNKELKIKIVELAIETLKKEKFSRGCCYHMFMSIYKLTLENVNYTTIVCFVPEFTLENAKRLSIKYKFPAPKEGGTYWWRTGLLRTRVKFLTSLLNEIKQN
jgi:hypothetical protein